MNDCNPDAKVGIVFAELCIYQCGVFRVTGTAIAYKPIALGTPPRHRFWFPMYSTNDTRNRSEPEPWPPFRVLCVDDNRDCANSEALLLRVIGFDSRACYDGHTALLLNKNFRPSICFLDLNMPGMDGDVLAVKLRHAPDWKPLLIIAVTAMSDEVSRDRIRAAGFDLHLVKPVDPASLTDVVNLLFRTAERMRESLSIEPSRCDTEN